MSVNRRRGRPKSSEKPIDRESIVAKATELLLERRARFSLRALARELGVDPMALYTYFSDREELEEAVATELMENLYRPKPNGSWRTELRTLIASYIDLLIQYRGLLETVVRLGERAKGPAAVFHERFQSAIADLHISSDDKQAALELIVDYVHGFVLAYEREEHGALIPGHAAHAIDFYIRCVASAVEQS